jgi:LPXTG-motif cell wall-anchored protein
VPVEIDYGQPPGWQTGLLDSSEQWEVVSQDSGVVSLIPLDLDTLQLPVLPAWSADGDTVLLEPPLLVVARTIPDTLYTVSVFPWPAPLDIPPGFPRDHLELLMFWKVWGGPPGTNWLLLAGIAALLAAVLVFFLVLRRRKHSSAEVPGAQQPPPARPSEEALALLESAWFSEGRWQELYREVDRLLRNSIEWKFGLGNRALTYGQVRRNLLGEPDGPGFMEEADPLVEEIVLQRYADWGSSRERAQRFIRLLARIMERWI